MICFSEYQLLFILSLQTVALFFGLTFLLFLDSFKEGKGNDNN